MMIDASVSLNGAARSAASPSSAGLTARAVLDMLHRAERALDLDPRQAKAFIDQASSLLVPMSDIPPALDRAIPGLAPWQERKIMRYISEHLNRSIGNRELAELVGLSVNYFSRRFKSSFGVPPRDYVIRSRLERAKSLMRQTRSPLCQIALESGFCDQAHLSRTFHEIVGSTPRRWRREHAQTLAA